MLRLEGEVGEDWRIVSPCCSPLPPPPLPNLPPSNSIQNFTSQKRFYAAQLENHAFEATRKQRKNLIEEKSELKEMYRDRLAEQSKNVKERTTGSENSAGEEIERSCEGGVKEDEQRTQGKGVPVGRSKQQTEKEKGEEHLVNPLKHVTFGEYVQI